MEAKEWVVGVCDQARKEQELQAMLDKELARADRLRLQQAQNEPIEPEVGEALAEATKLVQEPVVASEELVVSKPVAEVIPEPTAPAPVEPTLVVDAPAESAPVAPAPVERIYPSVGFFRR